MTKIFGPICGEIKSSPPNNLTTCWWDLSMVDPDFAWLWNHVATESTSSSSGFSLKLDWTCYLLRLKNVLLYDCTVSPALYLKKGPKFISSSNALSAVLLVFSWFQLGPVYIPFWHIGWGSLTPWKALLQRGFDPYMLVNLFNEWYYFQQWVLVPSNIGRRDWRISVAYAHWARTIVKVKHRYWQESHF